jgi:glycosyltransferase involved in cell wall biosynthesis
MLACSGLEHAHRGFESFARECFDELRDEPRLDIELFKATGRSGDRERVVRAITRDGRLAQVFSRRQNGPIKAEQLAFAFSLQREIIRRRPEVIYFSEWYTGVGLNALRALNRQQYALVLSNGSMAGEGFEPFDRVHQHTAPAFEYVLEHGADPAKQALLPVAFQFSPELELPSEDERRALRERLGLPPDRTIVISVAALNRWHKRLDYVIEELARLPEPRPYLLLVGQPEAETDGLRSLAGERLGDHGHSFRSVPRAEVDQLLRAADVFVLASFAEGLPRALVEAMDRGLPCLAHDYGIAYYAMGSHGRLADFSRAGALAGLLADGEETGWRDPAGAEARHRFVYDAFSWDRLRPQYVELLHGAVGRANFDGRPLDGNGSAAAHAGSTVSVPGPD